MFFEDAYHAAIARAAFIDRSERGRILVSGPDRSSLLQGLLTNDIASLGRGQGCYAAWLTPQGRMIADLEASELGDAILLLTAADLQRTVLAKLDESIFMEDVQLRDLQTPLADIAIVGPDAARRTAALVTSVPIPALNALAEHGTLRAAYLESDGIIVATADLGARGFDLLVERSRVETLTAALEAAGVPRLTPETVEVLRVEAGIPWFHRDMDEQTIPLEAGIEGRAISQTKGCYVGQEVIVRILHRGHGRVARRLVGLELDGPGVPAPGSTISGAGGGIGHVTSAVYSPARGRPIALGYVQRDFAQPGTAVEVDGVHAEVTTLA